MLKIEIQTVDVCQVQCDVLALKFAQNFYGADSAVAAALTKARQKPFRISPGPAEHVLIPSLGAIEAANVLFVGVGRLMRFGYTEIRAFAARALRILAEEMPEAKTVAMTMHGTGYGLDEREAFLAQLGGLLDAASGTSVQTIVIVEKSIGRADRLRQIVREFWPTARTTATKPSKAQPAPAPITAGFGSDKKPHIFVAMPFSKDLEDTFVFGIQGPINNAGYLCERVDMVTFTGDILNHIKSRIETAALVIADLTGANANVYLEVGYAWGKDRPTLLLVKSTEELKFDVRGQRCIVYENIVDLAKKLQADLAAMKKK